jgi:hypothetical protein
MEVWRVGHDRRQGHTHGGHVHGTEPWVRHRRLHERPLTFGEKVKQFLWGFMFFEWYHELQHERAKYNDVMNLILYGELIGIPLMNSSIGLRLLPYVLPELQTWKHRQLEEHEIIEEAPHMH